MASYEAIITPVSGDVLNGDIRLQAKVSLLRYETPTAKPVKAGSRTVRAWTSRGLKHAADDIAKRLMTADQAKRRDEILSTIARIETAQRVNRSREE